MGNEEQASVRGPEVLERGIKVEEVGEVLKSKGPGEIRREGGFRCGYKLN